jgi:hypothetical protein
LIFPIPWPAALPGTGIPATRRPLTQAAFVLYDTTRAKITRVRLVDGNGRTVADSAEASGGDTADLKWSGSHIREIDDQNVVVLDPSRPPQFGLALELHITFEQPHSLRPSPIVRIGSVGIDGELPEEATVEGGTLSASRTSRGNPVQVHPEQPTKPTTHQRSSHESDSADIRTYLPRPASARHFRRWCRPRFRPISRGILGSARFTSGCQDSVVDIVQPVEIIRMS